MKRFIHFPLFDPETREYYWLIFEKAMPAIMKHFMDMVVQAELV